VLFERARALRYVIGVEATADWMEDHGVPRALAIIALVGGYRASSYGVRIFDGP